MRILTGLLLFASLTVMTRVAAFAEDGTAKFPKHFAISRMAGEAESDSRGGHFPEIGHVFAGSRTMQRCTELICAICAASKKGIGHFLTNEENGVQDCLRRRSTNGTSAVSRALTLLLTGNFFDRPLGDREAFGGAGADRQWSQIEIELTDAGTTAAIQRDVK